MWGLKKKYPSAKATRIIRPTYALLKGWPYKRGSTVTLLSHTEWARMKEKAPNLTLDTQNVPCLRTHVFRPQHPTIGRTLLDVYHNDTRSLPTVCTCCSWYRQRPYRLRHGTIGTSYGGVALQWRRLCGCVHEGAMARPWTGNGQFCSAINCNNRR